MQKVDLEVSESTKVISARLETQNYPYANNWRLKNREWNMNTSETLGLNLAKKLNNTMWVSLERCETEFCWEMSMAYSWDHIEAMSSFQHHFYNILHR